MSISFIVLPVVIIAVLMLFKVIEIPDYMNEMPQITQGYSYLIHLFILGPIFEEIMIRGFLLGKLKKHGKIFAIVVSASIFALLHLNPIMLIGTLWGGLLYGYVAVEYSIFGSILLHMSYNVFSCVFVTEIGNKAPIFLQNGLLIFFSTIVPIIGVYTLKKYKRKITTYIKENPTEKGYYKFAYSSGIVLFLLVLIILK